MLLARRHLATAEPAFLAAVGSADADQARPLGNLRSSLNFDLVVSIGTVLVLGALAWFVRQPWRWNRAITWSVVVLFGVAVAFGIGSGPEASLSPTGLEPPELRRAMENLLVDWYSIVREVIALGQLVGLAAVAVLLFGEAPSDYYQGSGRPGEGPWTLLPGDVVG